MAVRIQFRRGTAAEWTAANPTLAAGELGYETDTTKFKLGDGTTDWDGLSYAGVTQADIEAAVEGVVGLAPSDLDTLVELAAAIGDDPDFANTILEAVDTHADQTTNVHGITDFSALETQTGAQNKANAALSSAQQYADNAIANLVASAPGTLDTLNELAEALGDDPNFATTITNSLAEKLPYIADTLSNLSTANAVTELDTVYIVGGIGSGYLKIGDNINHWNDVPYVGQGYADQIMSEHNALEADVHGISNAANLVYQSDLANHANVVLNVHGISNTANLVYQSDLADHANVTTNIHGIADTADLITSSQLTSELTTALESHNENTQNVHGIANTAELVTQSDLTAHADDSLSVHGISNTANLVYTATLENYATLDSPTFTGTVALPSTTTLGELSLAELATLDSPTFTGTVALPSTTSIGDISAADLETLANVTSDIQAQIDGKLASSVASTTYAPIASPTFTGTVALPSDTTIGDVSATELGYISTVTSNVQTQLDAKAPTANPTFTGTVSGITAAMVGLGDVDNTADADKPISDATQAALDAKLALAGGTMTGKITLDGDPTQALHATTKQYVDNVSSGILAKPSVVAATTANLTATYSSGTNGVGATLTATSNGAFPQIDGVSVTTVSGQRGVLVKNQTNKAQNGRYNLTTQGDANTPWVLTRCGLCDEASEIPGAYVFVTDGTVNGQTGWVQHVDDPAIFTVGTDDINVFQFAGSGAITAGNNISVVGNEVSLVDAPVFTDTITVSSEGIEFSDGTVQTSAGVASLTSFTEKTTNYTLNTLAHKDNVVEMNSSSATTFTIPTNANLAWPVGASMDIIQTGTGQVTITPASGVTLRYTPGNKLRTQWSSCTIIKRSADLWYMYGDLTA